MLVGRVVQHQTYGKTRIGSAAMKVSYLPSDTSKLLSRFPSFSLSLLRMLMNCILYSQKTLLPHSQLYHTAVREGMSVRSQALDDSQGAVNSKQPKPKTNNTRKPLSRHYIKSGILSSRYHSIHLHEGILIRLCKN